MDRKIPFLSLNLTPEDVYESMGYGGNTPDPDVVTRVQRLLKQASERVEPSYYFRQVEGRIVENAVEVEHVVLEIGSIIKNLLKYSTQFAIFVATSGEDFVKWNSEIKAKEDWVDLFIADSIGSSIAEKTGDFLEIQLEKGIGNLKHTNRFSPGYCGWNLTEQHKLFSLLPSNVCNISLNDSCLMFPLKSISGIIGIGENVNEKVYSCDVCNRKDCFRRKSTNNMNLI
jgi:hypothetical protein